MINDQELKTFISTEKSTSTKKKVWPKISIIIPSYNQGRFLERTILSIVNQDYSNTELVIIDGGSNDETINIIKKYKKHISYFESCPDRGQSHALNKGFTHATGNVLGWQNADDLYLPNTFNQVANIFNNNPKTNICYGNWLMINDNDNIIERTFSLPIRPPKAANETMNISNQSLFWKSSVHKKFGAFNEHLSRAMDYELILWLLLNINKNKIYYIDNNLAAFRRHKGQKTSKDDASKKEEIFLEKKYFFDSKYSIKGIFNRFRYRLFQARIAFLRGGIKYTLIKLFRGIKRNKGFL